MEYCSPQGDCRESPVLNNNSFSLEGLIPQRSVYTWRARSLDDAGNSKGYSAPRTITLSAPKQSNEESNQGCQQSTKHGQSLLFFIMSVCLIWRRRLIHS